MRIVTIHQTQLQVDEIGLLVDIHYCSIYFSPTFAFLFWMEATILPTLITSMKWLRIIFWSSLLFFYGISICFEIGRVTKEGLIRFGLFVLFATSGVIFIDYVISKIFLSKKRYFFFIIASLLLFVAVIVLEAVIEAVIFGGHPQGWTSKFVENTLLILPWMLVATSFLIAEHVSSINLEKTKAELAYLKHQVNPHFLLNTHNNIYFLIEQNPKLASEVLLKLSGMMQYMLYECNADSVLVENEFAYLKNYIQLERIRKNDSILIEYDFCENTNGARIAPLLLISFVENAFKHVSNFHNNKNFISVKACIENNHLKFDVTNSKAANSFPSENGIGLKNAEQRLRLLYKKKYSLNIINNANVYKINLQINLK